MAKAIYVSLVVRTMETLLPSWIPSSKIIHETGVTNNLLVKKLTYILVDSSRRRYISEEIAKLGKGNISAHIFTFRELRVATKNFNPENQLGEGGFGRVYKGHIETPEKVVAVKQLDRNGYQGNREFLVEVMMLSLLHHQNLVNLVGYCADGDQRILASPLFKDKRKFTLMADPLLEGKYPTKGLYQALAVAAMCLQEEAETRPTMSDVVTALEYLGVTKVEENNETDNNNKEGGEDERSNL
ncbi:hypothetical protein YC2023_012008 [Brassica napus]